MLWGGKEEGKNEIFTNLIPCSLFKKGFMTMALFLSESSAKSATIADLIGEKIDSLIITTPPVKVILHSKEEDKKEGKAFSFETIPASKEIVDTILSYADKGIFIAFDPDQRGEYMTWLISEFIKTHCHMSTRPKRIHLDCLTMEGLRESVKSPVENHYENGFAFYVRSLFDRLLVDNIEKITGKREGPSGLPYNFQTLTFLFFLNEREDEIENFSPSNKWQIRATVNSIKGEFEAKLETMGDITQDGVLKNKEEVEKALKYVAEKEFLVKSVSRVSKKIDTPSPFDTVNLVQEAFLQLKFNPEKTLKLSQELFHGTNINGNNHGIISSFITNEVDLPEERAQTLKEYILQTHGENVLGSYTVSYEGERIPVIPLLPEITPDQIAKALSQEAGNLYQLIRNRAFASQMKEAYGENVEVIIQVGDECTFSAFKTCITEKGYLDIYQNMEEKDLLVQEPISTLCEGQTLNLVNTYAEPSSGVPPEYYTLEAIFSDLAEMGISMDFLMAASLKELIQKDYIEITSRGVIRPRENCSKVVQLIDHAFPTMSGLNLSAYFSQTVDEVVSGRKDLNEALSQFSQTLTMHVNKTSKAGDSIPRRGETEAAQKQAMKTQVQEKGRVESILRGVPRGERRRDTATVIKSHMVEKNSSLGKLVFDDLGNGVFRDVSDGCGDLGV